MFFLTVPLKGEGESPAKLWNEGEMEEGASQLQGVLDTPETGEQAGPQVKELRGVTSEVGKGREE